MSRATPVLMCIQDNIQEKTTSKQQAFILQYADTFLQGINVLPHN